MAELQEIEVFRAGGPWHGKVYTDEDIEQMAENSNTCLDVFQAPLSLNHDEVLPDYMQNAVFGVPTRYYPEIYKGTKGVFADYTNVPEPVVKLLKFYPRRSVDLYSWFYHPDKKQRFGNVIKKVSFLGANMDPEVKGLFPIIPITHTMTAIEAGPVVTFTEDIIAMATYRLGRFLSNYRNAKGITTAQLAEEIDIPLTEMEAMLNGEVIPPDKILKKLIRTLGITAEAVLKSLDNNQSFMEDDFMAKKKTDPSVTEEEQHLESQEDNQGSQDQNDRNSASKPEEKVVQTVNITPSPQGFSQEDVDRIVRDKLDEQAKTFKEEEDKLNAELEEAKTQASTEKEKTEEKEKIIRHQEIATWYEGLKRNGLPAAFDDLHVVKFMEAFPQEQTIQFAEDIDPVLTIEHFKAIMEKVAEFAKVPQGELPIQHTEGKSDAEPKWKMAVKERMEKFNEDRTTALETVAIEHPEYFPVEE